MRRRFSAAQSKADSALRQAQDAHADLQRAQTNANSAAADLKTAQQNHATNPNPQAVTDAQTAHDTAQTSLKNAQDHMDALAKQAHQAHDDLDTAAKQCAKALHHAQSDGIHNKHWWEHVGEVLSEWGGKIAEIAGEIAPVLDVIALATSWIPGVDVITAGLAEADNIVALVGSGMQIAGDAMQGHFKDALLSAGMLGATYLGGRALGSLGGKVLGKLGTEAEEGGASALTGAEEGGASALTGAEKDAEGGIANDARTAEGNEPAVCEDDPVDVVSGQMLTSETDLLLPGVLPVSLRRAYASGYAAGRLFGPGWASTLDQRISINDAGIHFAGDDAQRLDYPVPAAEEEVLPGRGTPWPLVWDRASDEIRITDPWSGRTLHFPTVHHREDVGQIRDLTAVTDRTGNRITILRDEYGIPTRVESPAYRVAIDTAATSTGPRVTRIRVLDGSDHSVEVKDFRYDERGRLIAVVDSTGLPFTFEWDGSDRITAWTDRVGYRYAYDYDAAGRVVHTRGDGGYLSGSFAYHPQERTTVHTNSLGHVTTFRYDDVGHLVAETDPAGNTSRYESDRWGRRNLREDALGRRTRIEYDARGDAVLVEHPDGARTTAAYNDLHQPVAVTGLDGQTWRYQYDERGNLTEVTDPLGATSGYRYGPRGELTAVVDALGHVTDIGTDAAGLALSVSGPDGAETRVVRDAFGRIVEWHDPLGAVTATGWSVSGLPLWQRGPDGSRRTWRHDANGRVVEYCDALGGVTTFAYAAFDKLAERREPDGAAYAFAYDSELRLTSVTSATGAVWRYEYDALGNLTGETDFSGRVLSYRHDALGRIVERTNGAGQRAEFGYDAASRIVERRTEDGVFSYAYDPVGRLLAARGPESSVELTRDAVGRILTETVDGRTVSHSYDVLGRPVGRTTPSGAESRWGFDAWNRPSELVAGAGSLTFHFDAAGRQVLRVLNGAAELAQDFEPMGRLRSQRISAAGAAGVDEAATTLMRTYTYRADGAPTEIQDSLRGGRRYDLDAGGRVTAVHAASWTESYAYDPMGNLASGAAPALPDTSGERSIAGTSVRAAGRTHYEYDDQGRLMRSVRRTLSGQRKQWTYTWDCDDRLVRLTLPDGTAWAYTYDPLGRRTGKARWDADRSRYTDVTRFSWDGTRLAEQETGSDDAPKAVTIWDYEPGTWRPVAQRHRSLPPDASRDPVDEGFYSIVSDLSGAPAELVAADGRVVWHTTTTLFGQRMAAAAVAPVAAVQVSAADAATEPVACPLGFQGQYRDAESGLHYNVKRYYDPALGSYLSHDPLGLVPAVNDTSYVDNPLTAVDPLGLNQGNDVGLGREQHVAQLIGGTVAKGPDGQDIKITMPNVGSTGLDVIGPEGEYVFVGGPAKAGNPSKFGKALKISKFCADRDGVKAVYYLENGTPESAVNQAKRAFGEENVHTFDMPKAGGCGGGG